jgi:hypothetical protein
MKKLLALAVLLCASPVFAQSRPFTYETPCALQSKDEFQLDTCKVVETRESTGALRSRNIFSNRFGLTIKLRWNGQKFIQTDSHNKFEYKWDYKVGGVEGLGAWTNVMPGFYLQNVSWD